MCLLVPVLASPMASAQTTPQSQPTLQDVEVRDNLIANQESLLNTYRCQFNIDTQVVPGGCTTPTEQPTQPDTTGPAQTGQPTQPDSPGQFTTISTGHDHACGIRTDKTVACWGRFAFLDAVPSGQFTAIAAGRGWTCGITAEKTVQCWGFGYTRSGAAGEAFMVGNERRQRLGLAPFPHSDAPDGHFTAIDAGVDHICGIKVDKSALCWGNDEMDAPDGQFTAISSGSGAACGIRIDQTAICWGPYLAGGSNAPDGQFTSIAVSSDIAICGTTADQTVVCWGALVTRTPSEIGDKPTALDFSYETICAVKADKTAACAHLLDPLLAASFQAPKGQFTDISTGANLVCGIRADRTVACWGPTFSGETDAPLGHFTAIAAGGAHSCAIRTDNTAVCWGANQQGQSNAPDGHFTAIAAGDIHSCAIKTDQSAVCWGANTVGQEYAGQSNAPDGHFTAIAAGGAHSCAIRTDNTAVCWGANQQGQSNAPDGHFTAIAVATYISCAIRTDSTAVCWGNDTSPRPYAPAGESAAIAVSGAWGPTWRSCAIRIDSTIECWGTNDSGQPSAPTGGFTAISAGSDHHCGIRTNKSVECWGDNQKGQSNAPAGHFTAISAGSGVSCGIRTDNTAVCWNHSTSVPEGVHWVLPGSVDLGEILTAEAEMARLVNELRQGLGLAPLAYNSRLADVARNWSQTMRDTGQFVHRPFLLEFIPEATLGGENISMVGPGTVSLLDAVQLSFDGLVASPGHYANMTSPNFNTLGVGIAFEIERVGTSIEGSSFWFTQNFAYYP